MTRYEFIFEKSFCETPIKGRIIELGDEKEEFQPIITVNTFAYKIFLSDKPIEELQTPFEFPEYYREKTYYFGTRYTVEEYMKKFPKGKLPEYATTNRDLYDIVQASPVGVPFAFPIEVYKHGNIEVIDYKQARKINVSASYEIEKNHKHLYSF